MANARNRLIAVLVAASTVCAACSPNVTPTLPLPKPSPTETSRFSTHTGPIIHATLPSTWTETPTASATLTPTPTPVTPTATPTLVPGLATLCDAFSVQAQFSEGHSFGWNDTLALFTGTPLTSVFDAATHKTITLTVRFLATEIETGENLGVQFAGGQVFGMELPINRLPEPGTYTWKAGVYGSDEIGRCIHKGTFVVTRSADDLLTATAQALITPTMLPTPEGTDEATEDGTIPIFQGPIPGVSG